MSRNSYPSPVSSPRLSDLEDSVSSPAVVTQEPARRERVDTHRNLHQASAALEDAYRRIRRARRNLLELTETRALHDAQVRSSDQNEFNPGYEAITLTSDQDLDTNSYGAVEEEELEMPDTEGLLRRFDPSLDFQYTDRSLSYDTVSSNSTGPSSLAYSHPPTTQLPTPSTYIHPGLHPRRSQLESQLTRRRELLHNDPTTTIGRRVAAREAGSTTLASSLASWDGASARIMTVIERDIERIRAATRQRRSEPARQELQTIDAASRANRSLDVETSRRGVRNQTSHAAGTVSYMPPPGTSAESRRRRPGRGSVYPSPPQSPMSNQSGRLSILSNLPVQNLTTPVSAISRPLLFEEPSSYISAADFTRPVPNFRDEQTGPAGERSYVIRRTINADGEEHVHPINFEWSDEEVSPWALPRGQSDDIFVDYMSPPRPLRARPIRYVQRSDTIPNSQVEGNTLPRGWARLDPDGNEISSDEEDHFERFRRSDPEFPPRSSLVSSVDGVGIRTRLHPLDSNTNIPQGGEFNPRADDALHSELELRDQERWSVVEIPVVTCDNQPSLQRHASRGPPFSPNPLPMPLEDMVTASKKSQSNGRPRIIRVARHANLAGR